jgi:hypothetical protein
LSFVPNAELQLWRTVPRSKYHTDAQPSALGEPAGGAAGRGRSQAVLPALGLVARQPPAGVLKALSDMVTILARRLWPASPTVAWVRLGNSCATPSMLARNSILFTGDCRGQCRTLGVLSKWMEKLTREIADLLRPHQDQVQRLAEVPLLCLDSALSNHFRR